MGMPAGVRGGGGRRRFTYQEEEPACRTGAGPPSRPLVCDELAGSPDAGRLGGPTRAVNDLPAPLCTLLVGFQVRPLGPDVARGWNGFHGRCATPRVPLPAMEPQPSDRTRSISLVGLLHGAVVAAATLELTETGGRARVQVIVDPGRRGRGIGSALLASLGATAVGRRAVRLAGQLDENDVKSLEWARRHGFAVRAHLAEMVLSLDDGEPRAGRLDRLAVTVLEQGTQTWPEDLQAAAGLTGSPDPDPLGALPAVLPRLLHPPLAVVVREPGGACVGFSVVLRASGHVGVEQMAAVEPAWASRGLDLELRQWVLRAARAVGLARLYVTPPAVGRAAEACAALGFRRLGGRLVVERRPGSPR